MDTKQTATEDQKQDNENHETAIKKTFSTEYEAAKEPDKQISVGIEYMKKAISQKGTPSFKAFWEIRKQCLPLFKESMNSIQRKHLWGQFVELSSEARRLKELLDEQTNFAVEQIDLAIESIEKDINAKEELLSKTPNVDLPKHDQAFKDSSFEYASSQKTLQFFNTLALRVNALRKELIQTDMRISQKNKLFKRLSQLGDIIFPIKKERIEQISEAFLKDVNKFVLRHFEEGSSPKAPNYVLREEIKNLQLMAKVLTLHTAAFTKIREMLSQCWDRLKELDKARKQADQSIGISDEVQKEFNEKFAQFEEKSKDKKLEYPALKQESKLISDWLATCKLKKDQEKLLFQKVQNILAKFEEVEAEKRARLAQQELEKNKKNISKLKQEMQTIIQQDADKTSWEKSYELFKDKVEKLSLKKLDQHTIQSLLLSIKDKVLESAVKECISTNIETVKKEEIESLYNDLKTRKQQVKQQLETYRKTLGSSNIDIEQCMIYQELYDSEKNALEKISDQIDEIEGKLYDLEGN